MKTKTKPPADFKKTAYVIGVLINGTLHITRQWDHESEAVKAIRNHPTGRLLKVIYEAN